MKTLPVVYRTAPFAPLLEHAERVEGMSVLEMVRSMPGLPAVFDRHGEVVIDGEVVPRAMWPYVRPRARGPHEPVLMQLALAGGGGDGEGEGGGGKSTFATIATIAVIAAAAAVSGGALVPLLGAGFASGTIGASLAAAAVSLGGSLAIAALTPPPAASATGDPGTTFEAANDARSGAASIQGNVLRPGGPIPRVPGTRRLFPPMATEPLIDIDGDTEVAESVMICAGQHKLEDLRLGSTPIADIAEVTSELRTGSAGEPPLTLVTRQGKTETVNIEVSQHEQADDSFNLADQSSPENSLPRWHAMRTRTDPDEFWVSLTWPAGVFRKASANDWVGVPLRCRLRAVGTSTWTNLPEFHIRAQRQGALKRMIKIKWATAPTLPPTPGTNDAPYLAYKEVPGQNGTTIVPATAGWSADARFSAGAGNDYLDATNLATSNVTNIELHADRVDVYMDPADKGTYEVQIIQGAAYISNNFTASTYVYSGNVLDLFGYRTNGGFHQALGNLSLWVFDLAIPRAASVWNEDPAPLGGDALIAVKVRNRPLDRLSVLASGYVRDYNAATGEWDTLVTTSNPAAHFRDVLAGSLTVDRLPASLIDDASLVEWRTYCAAQGLECNAVIEGRSAFDVLTLLAACGRARPRQSEDWGVFIDRDRSAEGISDAFSPRNMRNFSFSKAFAPRPDGFRITFPDATRDYDANEIIVFDPEGDGSSDNLEDIEYDGLVTEAEVTARALFDFAQADKRLTFYSGEAAWNSFIARRGDLVGVQYDTIDPFAGFARIKSVTTDGGTPELVTGLELDGTIVNDTEGAFDLSGTVAFSDPGLDAFADDQLGIAIVAGDATVVVTAVTGAAQGETDSVTIDTPFENAAVAPGDHVTAGRLGQEFARMILVDVKPRAGKTAQLTFVDEAPEIHA